jgi:predicted TIM-barrel fold metal-dependent hydrolase
LNERRIDCHAHVIDHRRFPFDDGPGYKPRPDEDGPVELYRAVLERNGVQHALLVQPSCYGTDNAAMLDAIRGDPGRFKGIAMVEPDCDEKRLRRLAEGGVVGARFNLVVYKPDAVETALAAGLFDRLRALDWFVQVFATDAQWAAIAEPLRRSGARLLIDHFGTMGPAEAVQRPGFQAVLALGREGRAAIKLSAPFRLSRAGPPYADLEPVAASIVAAFGVAGCVWGSDWPFLNLAPRPDYDGALAALSRWLPGAADRDAVLHGNPVRLFGFEA